jgi:hypothetical protein
MFAGLPGIGVGTLFYILMAVWMPFRELPRVVQGKSSLTAWALILRQLFHSAGILVTVMMAERLLVALLDRNHPHSFSPAALIYGEMTTRAGGSLLAAPIAASLMLLGGVVLTVEVLRFVIDTPDTEAPLTPAQRATPASLQGQAPLEETPSQ